MARLLLAAIVVGIIVWLIRGSYLFRLEFRGGSLESVKGTVPGALRSAFEDVASRSRVTGVVSLYPGHLLRFSRGVAEVDRQRFRNVLGSML